MDKISSEVEPVEIDVQKVFFDIYQYKWMILLSMLIFGSIGSYYAYFLPNVYKATASIKVGVDKDDYAKDVVSIAMGRGAINASTEKDLIKSRYLSDKVLQKMDFREHYYEVKHYRATEIYKNSPFSVSMTRGYGILFDVHSIDKTHYRLMIKEKGFFSRLLGNTFSYDRVHEYGEKVHTSTFSLILTKKHDSYDAEYQFLIDASRRTFGRVSVVQYSEHSTILQVSVEDTVALRSQEYANALAQAYIQQNIETKTQEATERLSFIEKQLYSVSHNIETSASHLEDFREETKVVNVAHNAKTILARIDTYETDLMNLEIEEAMLKAFYTDIQSAKKIETLSISGVAKEESILAQLMKELQETIIERNTLRQDYTNLHPVVIQSTHKIKQLKNSIKETSYNLVKTLEKRKYLLTTNIEKQRKKLQVLPEKERQFGQLEHKFKMHEEINSYLLKQKSEAQMVKESSISKNRMLDLALLPTSPIKPKRKFIVMIGFLLGLALGILFAFLRVFLDTKIKDESDVSQLVAYPILGTIPHIRDKKKNLPKKIKVFETPKSSVAESFRHLRGSLEFMRQQEGSQIILLTSSVGQEGKTTLCTNLGAIMSLSIKRTIILNLDFRKPTLHTRFNLPNKIGLSELLNKQVALKDVIQCTQYPYLDIISSGAIPPNPSELIHNQGIYGILEELKTGYDIIIIDTPPIGLVTDAKELMHYVDINLYIVRADYSKKFFLKNLIKFNKIEKLSNLGLVLNDVKKKRGSYGYYDGHGYYEEDDT